MTALTINLLGPFEVTRNGLAVDGFEHDKVRALLAYLVSEADRPHARATLAALLWPDDDRRRGLRNLSQALYLLRRTLDDVHCEQPYLLVSARSLQWNPDAPVALDTAQLDTALHRARQIPSGGPIPAALVGAAERYRAEFMAGFSLAAGEEFDEWLTLQREHYRTAAMELLRRLADQAEEQEAWGEAAEYARRRLDLDAWQEDAHRQLMRIYAALDRPDDAIAQYCRCSRLLKTELGVEPSAATEELYRRIQTRRGAASLPSRSLPAPLSPLIGRDAELDALAQLLDAGDCRLITLLAPGGYGKTRLAIAAATAAVPAFHDGVCFVELAALESAHAVPFAIADALGLSVRNAQDAEQRLTDYLYGRSVLLILDNFEHLLDAAGMVVNLLEHAAGLQVLVTSRARLNVMGEHLFPLKGLALPKPATVDADESGAVALFLLYTRRLDSGYRPTPDEYAAIARICRALDGMPLALILAAGWMDTLDATALAESLTSAAADEAKSLDLLQADWPDLPARQRSMRRVIAHSWNLLEPADQSALSALSIFRGGFTAATSRAVAGINLARLRRLTDRSLVQRVAYDRYDMHDLLRRYARGQLGAVPADATAAADRHSHYFSGYVAERTPTLHAAGQLAAMADLDRERDNLIAAWRHAAATADDAALMEMAEGFCTYLERRGRIQLGEELCRSALAGGTRLPRSRVGLTIQHAHFLRTAGRIVEAKATLEDLFPAIQQAALCVPYREQALAYLEIAQIGLITDVYSAEPQLQESLRLARQIEDESLAARVLLAVGRYHFSIGEFEPALESASSAEQKGRYAGAREIVAGALEIKSGCYGMLGDLEACEAAALEGIALWRELGDEGSAAGTLNELASKHVYAGRFRAALRIYDEMAEIAERIGDRAMAASADHFRGWSHTNLGHYDLALGFYTRADRYYRMMGREHMNGLNSLGIGEVQLAQGKHEKAYCTLQQAEETLHRIGQTVEEALVIGEQVLALRALGRIPEAWEKLRVLLAKDHRAGAFPPALNAINGTALLLAQAGEAARALELHTLAMQHPYLTDSVYRDDVIGRHIRAAAAELSPDARQEAIERARTLDVLDTVDALRKEFCREREIERLGN